MQEVSKMSLTMRIVWLYFLLRKKLGLAKIGQPPRAPARPTERQLKELDFQSDTIDGFIVNRLTPKDARRTVVYLHGGGYVQPIAAQHWDLIANLARETRTEFIVPRYGLSPKYKVDDALGLMGKLRKSLPMDKEIILMGDSAGGGLALSLAQTSWNFVSKLILISPWVDSEFGEETKLYEKRDPWLNAKSLRYIATVWSGQGDYKRKEVSPLRGEFHGLPPTALFVGDYELFYPNLMVLWKRMTEAGVKVELFEQRGGLHVFPLIPSSEGKAAQRNLQRLIAL